MSLSVRRRVRSPNEALGFPWEKAGALVIAEACEQEFRRQIHAGGIDTHGFRFVAIASTDSFAGERSLPTRYSHRLRRSSKFR